MKLILILLFTTSISLHAQVFIDMTKELSNISETLLIDGNILKKKYNIEGDVIIKGGNMFFKNNSRVILNNVIIQLTGSIVLEEEAKIYPKFINSYIFCKSSDQWTSENVIIKTNFKEVKLEKVDYLKKLEGNPKIFIYNSAGQNVYTGYKSNLKGATLPIGIYDLRVQGMKYQSDLLFY